MKAVLPARLPPATCRVRLSTPLLRSCRQPPRYQTRGVVCMASMSPKKREGDISDAFASMSGKAPEPLPDRYRQLKLRLVQGHEEAVIASWKRLLSVLQRENEVIAQRGPSIVPEIRFSHLEEDLAASKPELKKRGVAVIKGVIPEDEARAYKYEIEEYVRQNPHTKGFPSDHPQVLELYWSSTQARARFHPSLLKAQTTLMSSLWHASNPSTPISLSTPLCYADRLRIRQPGDAQFALGPHQDGGSVERWEENGYGLGGIYNPIFRGDWESYDPFDASGRLNAVTNLHDGLGACSMFRTFQGWLSMSKSGPGEGTLLVNPLVRETAVYTLLRPFFRDIKTLHQLGGDKRRHLEVDNWEFTGGEKMTSDLQGASPGHGQEFPEGLHPHLELERTMVHVLEVRPGDYVVWHCDTIHAVDKTHNGHGDSSVMYIPICPTTEASAQYVARQRAAFLEGTPAPDFPGGEGESRHIGRPTEDYVMRFCDPVGVQSLGLDKLVALEGDTPSGKEAVRLANQALGFI
ncbi:hypothetical protein QC762_508080 [Podospora pseudocomata]|uniref:DUF1479 domain protein n=1 Tax=Podospora pseudocomata TaxID=2093779 RepID=A0ABR0GD40_9PEZI|nr:hypothetical protein QC762_508080 [Podospora pseudocomata]